MNTNLQHSLTVVISSYRYVLKIWVNLAVILKIIGIYIYIYIYMYIKSSNLNYCTVLHSRNYVHTQKICEFEAPYLPDTDPKVSRQSYSPFLLNDSF